MTEEYLEALLQRLSVHRVSHNAEEKDLSVPWKVAKVGLFWVL
jgi:hypothetical protein